MRYPEPLSPVSTHRKLGRTIAAGAALFGTLLTPLVSHALEPGDSNRDLRISAADLPALIGILAGQPGNEGADANRDGFVLADDVVATVARIFGRPLFEPIATPTTGITASPAATSSATPSVTGPPVTGTATRSPTVSPTFATTAVPTTTATMPALPSPTPTPTATFPTGTHSLTPTPTRTPTHLPTSSPTPTSSSTPSVTATLSLATPMPTVTPTATGPATPIALTRCSDTLPGPLSIPNNNSAGISNSFVVPDVVSIADLNVEVVIAHTFVGDLRVIVTHVPTATGVVLINRAVGGMCRENNISATFDDQAARFAGFSCSMHDPALGGGLVPDGFLGEFSGDSLAGMWRLEVADLAAQDQGTLVSWCLRANSTVPVLTSITCDDAADCELGLGQPFVLEFAFADRDGNASGYRITARDSFGNAFPLAEDIITPPAGDGMIAVSFPGFSCNDPPCSDTVFEYFVVVVDADGQESPFASIVIMSLGT